MCPVRIGDERVEPDDSRRKIGRYEFTGGRGVEVERAVEISQPDVDSVACAEEILNLRIGLGAAERFSDVDQREVGRRKSRRLRQQASDQLGDERLRALAGAPKLGDEETAAEGIDYRRERAALTKGWTYLVAVRTGSGDMMRED